MPDEEPLVQIMAVADELGQEHEAGEIIAALLSCALIRMIENDVTHAKAIALFTRSADFAYTQGALTNEPH